MWFRSSCSFLNVLILRKMHNNYVFSNLLVIKDLHEAVSQTLHSKQSSARRSVCANSKICQMPHTHTTVNGFNYSRLGFEPGSLESLVRCYTN